MMSSNKNSNDQNNQNFDIDDIIKKLLEAKG